MIYSIPFKTNTPYSFTSTAGKNNFKIHIKYCISDDTYFIDIDQFINGSYVPIISCINITVGCDLFMPFQNYGLGNLFVLPTDNRYMFESPHSDTLVSNYILVWEHD